MRLLPLIALLGLMACGVDGPPEPPQRPGVKVTGEVQFGMSGKL